MTTSSRRRMHRPGWIQGRIQGRARQPATSRAQTTPRGRTLAPILGTQRRRRGTPQTPVTLPETMMTRPPLRGSRKESPERVRRRPLPGLTPPGARLLGVEERWAALLQRRPPGTVTGRRGLGPWRGPPYTTRPPRPTTNGPAERRQHVRMCPWDTECWHPMRGRALGRLPQGLGQDCSQKKTSAHP